MLLPARSPMVLIKEIAALIIIIITDRRDSLSQCYFLGGSIS